MRPQRARSIPGSSLGRRTSRSNKKPEEVARTFFLRTGMKTAESSTLAAAPQFLTRYGQSVVGLIQNSDQSFSFVVWDWQGGLDSRSHHFHSFKNVWQVFVDERAQTISIAGDKEVWTTVSSTGRCRDCCLHRRTR
jgi:hypothetical protein